MTHHTFFSQVKKQVESGEQIDINSVLEAYLELYYRHSDTVWLDAPLSQRPEQLQAQLDWLTEHGAEINPGLPYLPLMQAVCNLDAHMVEYLLEKGARAQYDLPAADSLPSGCGNLYIDILDTIFLEQSYVENPERPVLEPVCRISALLAKNGVVNVKAHCISIDGNTREVHVDKERLSF